MEKEPLILREYGRNVQKLVKYINSLPTVEERTKMSHVLIQLMKQINPAVKENTDNNQRIWDHLYVMADFNLEIDGPYPKPDPETLISRPQRMGYRYMDLKHKNYGRNIQNLITKVASIENAEEREPAITYLARMMKSFYAAWNKENITDEMIADHLFEMSHKKIDIREQIKKGQLSLDTVIPAREPSGRDVREHREGREEREFQGNNRGGNREGGNREGNREFHRPPHSKNAQQGSKRRPHSSNSGGNSSSGNSSNNNNRRRR
jgi:Domain of unknown function (DUF4290)